MSAALGSEYMCTSVPCPDSILRVWVLVWERDYFHMAASVQVSYPSPSPLTSEVHEPTGIHCPQVKLLFFAKSRELTGHSSTEVHLPVTCTRETLLDTILTLFPWWGAILALFPLWGSILTLFPQWGAILALFLWWGANLVLFLRWDAILTLFPQWGAILALFLLWGANLILFPRWGGKDMPCIPRTPIWLLK